MNAFGKDDDTKKIAKLRKDFIAVMKHYAPCEFDHTPQYKKSFDVVRELLKGERR